MTQQANNLPAMQETQETWVQSPGWKDPLEEETASHSSILAWRIPWTEKPGRLPSTGWQGVGRDWAHEHSLVVVVWDFSYSSVRCLGLQSWEGLPETGGSTSNVAHNVADWLIDAHPGCSPHWPLYRMAKVSQNGDWLPSEQSIQRPRQRLQCLWWLSPRVTHHTSPLPLKAAGHIGQLWFRVGQDWTRA